MTNSNQANVCALCDAAEKELKPIVNEELLFVAAVDTKGNVSYFLPKGVTQDDALAGPCDATKLIESDAISYAIFEGNSRHSIIKSGGTKIHIKR
jgi:hypothetical protein